MELTSGASYILRHAVEERDTAIHWQGDFEVLSTPTLLGLSELACMKAIADQMPEGSVTVGVGFNMQHLAATPKGYQVEIAVTLRQVEGRRLSFDISASDGQDQILSGTHERAVVSLDKFQSRLEEKKRKGV